MKKLLLPLLVLAGIGSANAQVIFNVESPAAIAGEHPFDGVDIATWPLTPDMTIPLNYIQGTLQLVAEPGGDTLACSPLSADLTGKIAVLYRGSCEFGTKALNAENAGAIGVIIINIAPGVVGMGPGTDGPSVSVPVLMISSVTGAAIRAQVDAGTDVEIFYGTKNGLFDYDIGFNQEHMLRAPSAVTPQILAQNASEFSVEVGTWVFNYGLLDQTNVSLSAEIKLGGASLYSETSTPIDIPVGDSAYFVLPTFSQTTYNVGYYHTIYEITSDNADEYMSDNNRSADFSITGEGFSYCGYDSLTMEMTGGTARRSVALDAADEQRFCIAFSNPNASRVGVTGIEFAGATSPVSEVPLDNEYIEGRAYSWDDSFTGISDPNFALSALTEIAYGSYVYDSDLQNQNVFLNFEENIALVDNQRYLFCITAFSPEFQMPYNTTQDYQLNQDSLYDEPISVTYGTDADGAATWYGLGFGNGDMPRMQIPMIDVDELVPSVSFNNASVIVNESAGTISMQVDIVNPNANSTTVDVALGASTATNGDDFNYTTPTTVTFPAGSSASQTVMLTIIDDVVVELSENVVLNLENPTNNATIGAVSQHAITITDNDVALDPVVTFDLASVTVNEDVGTVTVQVDIANPNANSTTVNVALGASTATNGSDFNYTTPTTVTFPAGSSASQTVMLTIIDDVVVELSENVVLNLENTTNNATIGAVSQHAIIITDNDVASNPVVTFDLATVTVNEDVGTVTVNIAILSENGNATSVDVVLGASTATNGVDFNYTTPTTVTFPAGSATTQTVTLTIIDDIDIEGDENIVLNLQNSTNSASIGSNDTQTITIVDNDVADPLISFNTSATTVNESAGTISVQVDIANPNANTISVDVSLGASTAINGSDFSFNPTMVTFPAGSNASQTIMLTIIDDAIIEGNEYILLSLQNPTNGATIGSIGTQTITIADNDAVTVSFEAAALTVNESAGTVLLNITLANANANATSVDVSLGVSTATIGIDFTYTTTTVTFPAGSSTTQTVFLGIIDDAIVETSENIVLNLQNPTNGATIGSNATTTINITDNESNSFVENSLESIVMYPNPTSNGSITLKGIKHQNVIIEIANIIGQTVYKNTVPTNGVINLTDVSKGTYIVTLFNDADRISKKLIIE